MPRISISLRERCMLSILAVAVMAVAGGTRDAAAATAPLCSSLDSTISYTDFGDGCRVLGVPGPGQSGQDTFDNVSAIVDGLFSDESIFITAAGSFAPGGGGVGKEFNPVGNSGALESRDGFAATFLGSTVSFTSLPTGTVFISLKNGNAFHLFPVLEALNFSLTHHLNQSGISHVSTFAGTVPINPGPGTNPVPLPAAAWMLLAGIAALAGVRSARS